MKEPRRLLESEADDFERSLLASSERDVPNERAYRRTLSVLGVSALVPIASAGVAHAGASAAALPAGAKLGSLVLGKWLAAGLALGTVTATGVRFSERAFTQPQPAYVESAPARDERLPESAAATPHAVAPPAARSAERPEEKARVPVAPRSEAVRPAAPVEPPPAAPVVAPNAVDAAAPVQAPSADTLGREMQLLDSVRSALKRGDADAALTTLRRYRGEFAQGALAPESRVLEISALIANGQRERAAELGERVMAADPNGQHAETVRALLGSDKP